MIEFLGVCVLKRKTLNEKINAAKTEPRKLSNHLVSNLLFNKAQTQIMHELIRNRPKGEVVL